MRRAALFFLIATVLSFVAVFGVSFYSYRYLTDDILSEDQKAANAAIIFGSMAALQAVVALACAATLTFSALRLFGGRSGGS